MNVTINGALKQFENLGSVGDLLKEMELDPQGVVVELNERIVRRNRLWETPVSENDSIEILRFVGGG